MVHFPHILYLFDVSGGEMLVIVLFALLFFGSKNIPELMRGFGRGYREFRNAANSIQREIQKGSDEVKGEMTRHVGNPLDKELKNLQLLGDDAKKEFQDQVKPLDQQFEDLDKEISKDPDDPTPKTEL